VARNDVVSPNGKSVSALDKSACCKCNGKLERVGNRHFLIYKRARLPQPSPEALVCQQCGWVEGDERFKTLLEDRIRSSR
jgi:hypothetical protein